MMVDEEASTEVLSLSKGWREVEQLVIGKAWMNMEVERNRTSDVLDLRASGPVCQ
jgi:hypothetical protein